MRRSKTFAAVFLAGTLLAGMPAFAQKQMKPKSKKEADAIQAMLSAQDPDARIKAADELITNGCLNGLFVTGRTIGFIGHYIDQKRLKQGLYRHPWDDISYQTDL